MLKAAVLYGHPTDAAIFEKYYAEQHLPIVLKVQGISKAEYTKFLPGPDGTAAPYYRMAELYFYRVGRIAGNNRLSGRTSNDRRSGKLCYWWCNNNGWSS